MATKIDSDVTLVMAHLRTASEAVDRLWNASHEHQCDAAVLGLGEASLAIHQALLALAEWDSAAAVDGPRPWSVGSAVLRAGARGCVPTGSWRR
jgi:hypothetical protein